MALVNYSQILHRFSHIDATFVACNIVAPGEGSFYRVSLYPWWEHPLYLEAVKNGRRWSFSHIPDEAYKHVTVYARRLREAQFKPVQWEAGGSYLAPEPEPQITDWIFTRDHPLLWGYEKSQAVVCNSALSVEHWMEVVNELCIENEAGFGFELVNEYALLDNIYRHGNSGSFLLGNFPRPLALALGPVLKRRAISYFFGQVPEPVDLPVLFLAGEDYIVADDFDLDVPEFVHDPSWFTGDKW